MKNLLMMACLCTSATGAMAQAPGVTVYGLVDVAVEHLTGVGAAGAGLTRMPGLTGSLPSRLGFRGSEDLGGGLQAVFVLEQGLTPDTGSLSQGGRAFGRQAYVGLTGPWGAVTLGRQYTMLFWSLTEADILGPSIYSSSSLDSYIPNARADNTIAYRGSFGGLTVGVTYSLGRDGVNAGPSPAGTRCPGEAAGDARQCREWSAMLKYDTPSWGAALAVDELRGGPEAFAGLTASALKDRRVSANGYARFGALKVGGGLIRRDNDGSAATPRSNLWYLGAAWQALPQVTIEGEVFRLGFRSSANRATLAALRATYHLSKRTAAYVHVARIDNDGAMALSVSGGGPGSNPAAGTGQSGIALGVRHSF